MARGLPKITLRDVYAALGSPLLFAIGNRSDTPECLVEQAVNAALDTALRDAETLLLARFGEVTLAMLKADVGRRHLARTRSRKRKAAS